jgi:hypothetical protein
MRDGFALVGVPSFGDEVKGSAKKKEASCPTGEVK